MMTSREFLALLFGHPSLEGMYIPLWFKGKDSRTNKTWPVAKLDDAAAAAMDVCGTFDVYVRTTPIGFMPEGNSRGGADDARALVALYADVDVAGAGHAKTTLPQTQEQAFDLLYECALAPSAVVNSGGGLHAWWVFKEPLIIDSPARLAEAKAMESDWENHLKDRARKHGWNLDSVSDLARVLRIPGTKNHKTESPRPVEIVHCPK
jgi:hypothetical protein